MKKSVFKSVELRDKMRAYYSNVLAQFPFEQKYVETTYGRTFILAAGEKTSPPLILIHGSNSNSAFWFPEITAFSSQFRVYAVDLLGEAGNSDEHRPDLNTDDFAIWMREVQNALGIEKSIVIGNSLGGWMALKFATFYPEHVEKLVLMAPSGLAAIHQQFLENVSSARQDDGTVPVTEEIIGETNIPSKVLIFMNLIAQSYTPVQAIPLFSDEQLMNLNMPVVFVGGEDDVIIDVKASAQRLSRLIPSSKIMMLPNCGHMITNVAEYILPLLV